ncbi:hypothetical protein [Grimontia celer]|nr:hypothetical protein [Grimontia celer]
MQEQYISQETKRSIWVDSTRGLKQDSYLRESCLPAHFAILPMVKQVAENAGVVIGVIDPPRLNRIYHTYSHIAMFSENARINTDPEQLYHAWIKLNLDDPKSDILDITSAQARHSENGFLGKHSYKQHIEILTNPKDVYHFHAKYVRLRFSKYQDGLSPPGLAKNYLKSFATQQSVDESVVMGVKGESPLTSLLLPFVYKCLFCHYKRTITKGGQDT